MSQSNVELPAKPGDASGDQLFEYLDVKTLLHDVGLRTKDLMKLVEGAHHELANLQQMTDVINTKQLEDVFRNVDSNTKYLVDASAASERSSASLEVMQVILAGSFAFDIVDRVSGGSLNITVPDWVNSFLVDPIITVPGLWMLINLAWLGFVSLMLIKLMRYLGDKANGVLTMRIKVRCALPTSPCCLLHRPLPAPRCLVPCSTACSTMPSALFHCVVQGVVSIAWHGC